VGGATSVCDPGRGYGSKVRAGRRKVWSRGERRAAIDALLSAAMIEIRYLASRPDASTHPDGHLAEIRLIADVCHRLAGAEQPRPAGEYDALVWTWQVADDFQRSWLRTRLGRTAVDVGFLEQALRLPRPATAPDTSVTRRCTISAATARHHQTEAAVTSIRIAAGVVPAALAIGVVLVMLAYPLTERTLPRPGGRDRAAPSQRGPRR
jgi:hypothetical protein